MRYNDLKSQTEWDIKNITDVVDIENKSILELGCGNGRVSFSIAKRALKLTAVDIDANAIEEARNRNKDAKVTFLIRNIEDFHLGEKFDVILSIGVGYMYFKDLPSAVKNISNHLQNDGICLLFCSYPEDEYQKIVNLLVENSIKTTLFYEEFEQHLSKYFIIEKKLLKGNLNFSNIEEVKQCFRRELKDEYQIEMNYHHTLQLERYFQDIDTLTVEIISQAYICRTL